MSDATAVHTCIYVLEPCSILLRLFQTVVSNQWLVRTREDLVDENDGLLLKGLATVLMLHSLGWAVELYTFSLLAVRVGFFASHLALQEQLSSDTPIETEKGVATRS
jgi:hypothetical protein